MSNIEAFSTSPEHRAKCSIIVHFCYHPWSSEPDLVTVYSNCIRSCGY